MDNYVLRIYRREGKKPDSVIGVLHDVHNHINRPFNGFDELSEMLLMNETICRRKKNKKVADCRRQKADEV